MTTSLTALAGTAALVLCLPAHAASSFYTDEAAFDAAAGGAVLAVEDFETAPSATGPTSVSFGELTFSCRGALYCPSNFGVRAGLGTDGTTTVSGVTPDALTFTFAHPIQAFGVDAIGVGTDGATSLTMSLSNGSSQVVLKHFYQGLPGANFLGAYDAAGFTSVTFTGSRTADRIDFDRLQFAAVAVPEPAGVVLMLAGLGLVGAAARRRQA